MDVVGYNMKYNSKKFQHCRSCRSSEQTHGAINQINENFLIVRSIPTKYFSKVIHSQ